MNQKPPELHLIDGTKSRRNNATLLPTSIRKRIPKAEWSSNPDAWDKDKFIEETSNFLFEVYGIGNDQDKHLLEMLADHIDTYVNATRSIKANTLIIQFNNNQTIGANPMLAVRDKATGRIIQLMNELGLTPRSRLSAGKMDDEGPIAQLMRGPAL